MIVYFYITALDVALDTSMNKPISPSSSITSQRKLEWDSLADVGYANESDRKMSASSLSTLERLALQQQYSNNDTRQNLGPPTAHSTPLDETEGAFKSKKGVGKKTTKLYKRDSEPIKLNVLQSSENKHSKSINVQLTKHISFSVGKSGEVLVENIKNDFDASPQKVPVDTGIMPQVNIDKQIQTTLNNSGKNLNVKDDQSTHKIPILMNVNTLKKKIRRRKLRLVQRKARNKKKQSVEKESVNVHERSEDQLSEAESFEYMPGHIYSRDHLKLNNSLPKKVVSNKSSLESSGVLTTDSSNGSKHSFTKDLEKSIGLLKEALQQRYDENLKNKLVKQIIQRLLKSKYRDDETTTDFLSGLSFDSKILGLDPSSTTSSSNANDTTENKRYVKPKKSILRMDKFNANAISSTSQSAPNLSVATHSDKAITSKSIKKLTTSNTDSDKSSIGKVCVDGINARTSSEELYRKYLDALKREETYKKHLKEKEKFLRQKLTSSDSAFKIPKQSDDKINSKFKDLMNDLIRNNYDDGSGDASKLECGSNSNTNYEKVNINNQRSHSVYTLSSCNVSNQSKKPNLKKRLQTDMEYLAEPSSSRENAHYCCCPHHSVNTRFGVTDSSVQVNVKDLGPSNENMTLTKKCLNCDGISQNMAPISSGNIKYVCLCGEKVLTHDVCDNFLIYKCSPLTNKGVQSDDISNVQPKEANLRSITNSTCRCLARESNTTKFKIDNDPNKEVVLVENISLDNGQLKKASKSSQTNLVLDILCEKSGNKNDVTSASVVKKDFILRTTGGKSTNLKALVHEATRCIQTEISINPQISDPSLPDIHIINDSESVKIISEQIKELSKCSSSIDACNSEAKDKNDICKQNSNKCEILEQKVDESNEKKVNDKLFEEYANSNVQLDNKEVINPDVITDNFTIPIQGTNMKLMVSIGSNDHRKSELSKIDSKQVKRVLEQKCDYSQESTSVGEESCNSVQYETYINKELITNVNNPQHDVDHNSNNVASNKHSKVQFQQLNKSCCDNSSALKFNTYPMNEKKTSVRTNTDTDNLVVYTQTNNIRNRDIMTQKTDTVINSDSKIATDIYSSQIPSPSINLDKTEDKHIHVETSKEPMTRDIETQSDALPTISTDSTNVLQNQIDKNYYTSSKCVGNGNVQLEKKEISSQPNQLSNESETSPESQSGHNSEVDADITEKTKSSNDKSECLLSDSPDTKKGEETLCGTFKDPILDLIKDITKRYSKDDMEKHKRKKCFKEIVTVLNYLLDTDDSTDRDQAKSACSCVSDNNIEFKTVKPAAKISESCQTVNKVDKGVQMTVKKSKNRFCNTESSDLVTSTDLPSTSTDSATCKVLNKIKKECERYHQKRCKCHGGGKKCDVSSSTSANCNQCNKVHHCSCRLHKCKAHKSKSKPDKPAKKSVAYNLIIQTSESMISEETVCGNNRRPLQNIIVRVPSRANEGFIPFRELEKKIENKMSHCSPRCNMKYQRSKSCPNEFDIPYGDDNARHSQECTVREYLEINRPDFIEKCVQRQDCMKVINKSR